MLISYSQLSSSLTQNSLPWLKFFSDFISYSFPSPSCWAIQAFCICPHTLACSHVRTLANLKTFSIFSFWMFFLQIYICYSHHSYLCTCGKPFQSKLLQKGWVSFPWWSETRRGLFTLDFSGNLLCIHLAKDPSPPSCNEMGARALWTT